MIKDPIASMLEERIRPNVVEFKKASLIGSLTAFCEWLNYDKTNNNCYDTQRVEKLIEFAWEYGLRQLSEIDNRIGFQLLRSLPPKVIMWAAQIMPDDYDAIDGIIRILTSLAINTQGANWQKGGDNKNSSIHITPEQNEFLQSQYLVDRIGKCIGAAFILYTSQGFYRWLGKGKRLEKIPDISLDEGINKINSWNGEGIFLMPFLHLSDDTIIEKSVHIYEKRRNEFFHKFYLSGLLDKKSTIKKNEPYNYFWFAGPITDRELTIEFPIINQYYQDTSWIPIIVSDVEEWIENLTFFENDIIDSIGLTVEEISMGIRALGLFVSRHTQCIYLKPDGNKMILKSPMNENHAANVIPHLYSILIRGTLRTNKNNFIEMICGELKLLNYAYAESLAKKFVNEFSGKPNPMGLPKPILFYDIDDYTMVLDLHSSYDFMNSFFSRIIINEGLNANDRGCFFEKQVSEELIEKLTLKDNDIPWKSNRDIIEDKINLGDVDFCFFIGSTLFNLDMKSWIRTDDYHCGHYHTIQDRQNVLLKYMKKVTNRGIALQKKLTEQNSNISKRFDFLVVNMPEYISIANTELWDGHIPKVITVAEIIKLANELRKNED